MKRYFLPALFLLAGCATTSKDFKPQALKPDEGAVVGKVVVLYNGNEFTDQCAICFNSVNGPCYKLDKTGFVVMKIKAGPTSVRRLSCMDTSEQHYDMNGANFEVTPGAKTYFGDLVFDWKNKGGFKVSSMFGLVGAIGDQSSNDGVLKVKVSSNPKRTLMSYNEIVREDVKLPTKSSIVSLPQ